MNWVVVEVFSCTKYVFPGWNVIHDVAITTTSRISIVSYNYRLKVLTDLVISGLTQSYQLLILVILKIISLDTSI